MAENRTLNIIREAKALAQEYRQLTGKPLGITGQVAEYEPAQILGLKLTVARQAGYDATEVKNGATRRLQVKGRCVLAGSKGSQRLGKLDMKKEWNAVLLVLLNGVLRPRISMRPNAMP